MEFFDNIVDLVVEGMGCVVDGVIAVSDFVEEHPVATSLVLTAATGGAAAWAGAGTIVPAYWAARLQPAQLSAPCPAQRPPMPH